MLGFVRSSSIHSQSIILSHLLLTASPASFERLLVCAPVDVATGYSGPHPFHMDHGDPSLSLSNLFLAGKATECGHSVAVWAAGYSALLTAGWVLCAFHVPCQSG